MANCPRRLQREQNPSISLSKNWGAPHLTGEICVGEDQFSGWVGIQDTICGDVTLYLQGDITDGWVEVTSEYYCAPYSRSAEYRFQLCVGGKGLSSRYWISADNYSDEGIFYMHTYGY